MKRGVFTLRWYVNFKYSRWYDYESHSQKCKNTKWNWNSIEIELNWLKFCSSWKLINYKKNFLQQMTIEKKTIPGFPGGGESDVPDTVPVKCRSQYTWVNKFTKFLSFSLFDDKMYHRWFARGMINHLVKAVGRHLHIEAMPVLD